MIFSKKSLTIADPFDIIIKQSEIRSPNAGMAELADALASGASLRKEVQVQVLLPAPLFPTIWEHSSAGRASALQAEGHRFEPCCSQSGDMPQTISHPAFVGCEFFSADNTAVKEVLSLTPYGLFLRGLALSCTLI